MQYLKKSKIIWVLSVISVLALSGCSGTPSKHDYSQGILAPTDSSSSQSSSDSSSDSDNTKNGKGVEVIGANAENSDQLQGTNLKEGELAGTQGTVVNEDYQPIIFFGFDQYDLDDKGVDIAKHYAQTLIDNPKSKVVLTGNTDERGTPEYNLALGEKRAKAVAQVMMLYGVLPAQIDVLTMGEEQPLVDGSTEDAWAKNRRVKIEIK